MRGRHTFFATCAPGVEPVLHEEARALKLPKNERQVGGVFFEGTMRDAWRANLWLRTAVRVLWRLDRFPARDADALYAGVHAIEWEAIVPEDATIAVEAQSKDSALDHTMFVAQRTKDAIVDRLRTERGARPSIDKEAPDVLVHVHLWRDRCTVSIDTSGESLHKRGWRVEQGRAPLAETLAAAILMLSRWDRRSPLVDPFCGSGTILVEAALLAGDVAPGVFREFAFESLLGHDAEAWEAMADEARAAIRFPKRLVLRGGDVDGGAIAAARANLEAVGLRGSVEIERVDARSYDWKPGWNGWIVCNPPYGERVGDERDLALLYRAFGERLRERCSGYHLALLSGNERLVRKLGFPEAEQIPLKNGAIDCRLVVARIG